MTNSGRVRLGLVVAALTVSGLALGACSPTYGTGTTSGEQLFDDLTGIASLGPKRRPVIDYKPRPDLVEPNTTEVLPPPQQELASTDNPQWPESPEERLARIRAEATANQNTIGYRANVIHDVVVDEKPQYQPRGPGGEVGAGSLADPENRNNRAEIQRRLAENKQGSAVSRKYLSEPPITYRKPLDSAPSGDIGEDEAKKQREARAAARKAGGKSKFSWRDLVPWM